MQPSTWLVDGFGGFFVLENSLFDHNTTYSIEIYMSSINAPGARRVGIVPSKYDFREIRLEDLENSRDIECHNYVLACDIQMSFGKITIHLLRVSCPIFAMKLFKHCLCDRTLLGWQVKKLLPVNLLHYIPAHIHPHCIHKIYMYPHLLLQPQLQTLITLLITIITARIMWIATFTTSAHTSISFLQILQGFPVACRIMQPTGHPGQRVTHMNLCMSRCTD